MMKALPVLLALLPAFSQAAVTDYERSSTGAPFLSLGAGARATAMGEAYSALADDAGAVFWNPAGLVEVEKRSATLLHSAYLDSISFDYGAFAQSLGADYGALGGSVHYLSAGELIETDAAGVEQGRFRPYDLALTLAYAYRFKENKTQGFFHSDSPRDEFPWLNGYSVGIAGKFVRSQIKAHSQTGTLDLGIRSPLFFKDRLRLAAVFQNLGGVLRFDKDREVLPFAAKLGFSVRMSPELVWSLEGIIPRENEPHAALGAEYRRELGGPWTALARLGFNSRTIGEVTGSTGVSAGVGVGYLKLGVDYSFVPLGTLGSTHQVSLSARF